MAQSADEPDILVADWRHLGVMPRGGRVLVIGGDYPELSSVFEVTQAATWVEVPRPPQRFGLVVVCTGIDSADSLAAMRAILEDPGGLVLILAPPKGGKSTRLGRVARSTRRLLQGSGLKVEAMFGALPGPTAPEYVFPLGRATAAFAIERFVLSRRPSWPWVRTALSFGPFVALATSFLPGGFILCGLDGDRS